MIDLFFPFKGVWNRGNPSKVSFFLWSAVLDKIITLDHLQSGGWFLANRCVLCWKEEESVDHLLMHCDMATMVWGFFLSHLKMSWVFPNHFHEFISGWWIRDWEALPSIIWTTFPGAIGWGLWNERNVRIFYDKTRSKDELILSIYRGLFDWCSIRDEFFDGEWHTIWCEALS